MDRRRGGREAGVALVFHHHQRARVGHGEIAAGHAHAGGQIIGPQVLSGDGRQGGVFGGVRLAQLFVEQLADFGRREVHGGRDDVDRPLPGSCTMYSPRSVSIGRMPASSRTWFNSISSVTIDFDLTTLFTSCSRAISSTRRLASAASSAKGPRRRGP